MKLNDYFTVQRKFQQKFFDVDKLNDEEKKKWCKEFSLELVKEVSELLTELHCKHHRKETAVTEKYNLTEEWVDVFKYLLNIGIVLGIENDVEKVFNEKSCVVEQRYLQEIKLGNLKDETNVVAFDIDDTLAESSEFFMGYFNKINNTTFNDINMIKKLRPQLYMSCKNDYRNSGLKRKIPLTAYAKETLDELRARGFKIVLISSRPYKKHLRIFIDTINWLEDNKLPYDAIYFDTEKRAHIKNVLPHLKYIVEDNLSYANDLSTFGINVYLLNNKYNKGWTEENVKRIDSLKEIIC